MYNWDITLTLNKIDRNTMNEKQLTLDKRYIRMAGIWAENSYCERRKVGALIVLQNDLPLDDIKHTGDIINAKIGQRLVENIFFKNSPLHDGAMIISGHRIAAAACMPVSNDLDIPKHFGLRHRAARGISKDTDALAIVVSEETGNITAAYNNKFRARLTAEELELILTKGKF